MFVIGVSGVIEVIGLLKFLGKLGYWVVKVTELIGLLVIGVIDYWGFIDIIGYLDYSVIGLLVIGVTGLSGYWLLGLLGYCIIGLLVTG